MNVRSAIIYSVLRLAAFFVPFGLMMLLPIFQQYFWLAAIFAALIGLSLSVIFLRRPLTEATSSLAARYEKRVAERPDDAVEDAANEALQGTTDADDFAPDLSEGAPAADAEARGARGPQA